MKINEIKFKLMDYYCKYYWPLKRLFIQNKLARRCKVCLLSEKYTQIDENSICSICKKPTIVTEEKLEFDITISENFNQLITETIKNSNRRYDALVLYSGGKDSSYIIYRLKNEFPTLKILAFAVDSGFMSKIAKNNIDELTKKLDVDLIFFKPKESIFKKAFKLAFAHLDNQKTCYDVVDRVDGDLIHDIARNFASQLEIPLLITGVSREQVRRIFNVNTFMMPEEIEMQDRLFSGVLDLNQNFNEYERTHYWWSPSKKTFHPKVIFPMFVWHVNEAEIYETLQKNQLLEKSNLNVLLTNYEIVPLMIYMDFKNLGYCSFEPEFAQMIREGKLHRNYWFNMAQILEYQVKNDIYMKKHINELIKRLELNFPK